MAATLTPVNPEPDDEEAGAPVLERTLRPVGGHEAAPPPPEPAPVAATPAPLETPQTPQSQQTQQTQQTSAREPRRVTLAQLIAAGLLMASGLLIAFAGYLFIGSSLAANRTQDVLYKQLQTDLAQATVPVSGVIAPGTPLGVVRVPAIGLDQVFVEGSSSDQTRFGPGLNTGSVLPGQTGSSILLGHRTTSGAAFAHLNQVLPGDRIEVVTGQGKFEFVVDLVRTSDAPATKVREVPSRLTLVTSDPAFVPNRNLTVSARLVGKALPASTGSTAPPSDAPGHGTISHLVSLLLWSQLLLLVTVLVTWAALRSRQRRWLWIGAMPVLLTVLWMVFENLALLLPNTL
jgi:sortase A